MRTGARQDTLPANVGQGKAVLAGDKAKARARDRKVVRRSVEPVAKLDTQQTNVGQKLEARRVVLLEPATPSAHATDVAKRAI